jgi:hypothetical protein
MKLQVAVLALVAASAAQASDWRYIMTTAGKDEPVSVDFSTLQRVGSSVKFWDKTQHKDGSYTLTQESVDCQARTWTLLYLQDRAADDSALNVYTPTSPLFRNRPIPPHSVVEQVKKAVCQRHMRLRKS